MHVECFLCTHWHWHLSRSPLYVASLFFHRVAGFSLKQTDKQKLRVQTGIFSTDDLATLNCLHKALHIPQIIWNLLLWPSENIHAGNWPSNWTELWLVLLCVLNKLPQCPTQACSLCTRGEKPHNSYETINFHGILEKNTARSKYEWLPNWNASYFDMFQRKGKSTLLNSCNFGHKTIPKSFGNKKREDKKLKRWKTELDSIESLITKQQQER